MGSSTRWIAPLVAAVLCFGSAASAITIDWVTIGDPGNAADPDLATDNCGVLNNLPCGSVASVYRIGKYEVTNAQYAAFLNAKAAADPYTLYDTGMNSSVHGGITRSGVSGSYTYSLKTGMDSKPVNFITFYDALRFTNWLSNGQLGGDTETGAYTLIGGGPSPSNGFTVTRNAGATIFLPNENEWYKAAYYDVITASYFDYPAGLNAATLCSNSATATPNRANCIVGAVDVETPTDVGAYTGSPSPNGTFDQGGNVHEWNETIKVSPDIFNPPGNFNRRGGRGGPFDNAPVFLGAAGLSNSPPELIDDSQGFRVASIPEPSTAALVMVGLLGLALSRERRA